VCMCTKVCVCWTRSPTLLLRLLLLLPLLAIAIAT
jgi:hypothetical protein